MLTCALAGAHPGTRAGNCRAYASHKRLALAGQHDEKENGGRRCGRRMHCLYESCRISTLQRGQYSVLYQD